MMQTLSNLEVGDYFKSTAGKYTIISKSKGCYKCRLINKRFGLLKEGSVVEFSGEINVKKVAQ